MTAAEGEQVERIRALRKVRSSPSLKDFLGSARTWSEDLDQPEDKPGTLVMSAESLRVILLERRAAVAENTASLIDKLYQNLVPKKIVKYERKRVRQGVWKTSRVLITNPLPGTLKDTERLYVPTDGPLVARAINIADTTTDDYRHLGTELSLVIDPRTAVADALVAQSDLLQDTVRQINAGKPFPRESPEKALNMVFMRAWFSSQVEMTEFIDNLSADLPVTGLELGPVEWHPEVL